MEAITFNDFLDKPLPHKDARVIKINIKDMIIHWILVDMRSFVNVMYYAQLKVVIKSTQPGKYSSVKVHWWLYGDKEVGGLTRWGGDLHEC